MKFKCPHCGSMAKITHHISHTEIKTEEFYCSCTNLNCLSRFVYRGYYTHTLQPPIGNLTDSLHEQIAHMDPADRKELFQPYLIG